MSEPETGSAVTRPVKRTGFKFIYYRLRYRVRRAFYVFLFFMAVAVGLSYLLPDRYLTSAQLLVESPEIFFKLHGSNPPDFYLDQSILGPVLAESMKQGWAEGTGETELLKKIESALQVKQVRGSRVFNVLAVHEDPAAAAFLAGETARSIVRRNFELSLYFSEELLGWLPSPESISQMIALEDPLGGVRHISREELIESLPSVQADETVRQLKARKEKLEKEVLELLKRAGQDHPSVMRARSDLKGIEKSLQREHERILKQLQTDAEETQVSHVRIIKEAATPESPYYPHRPLIWSGSAIIYWLGYLLFVFLTERFDRSLYSFEDFEEKGVAIPFLGAIPRSAGVGKASFKKDLVSYYDPDSAAADAFRYLRVAINFSSAGGAISRLLITSDRNTTGKTFIAQNLAVSLARDGNRTLLVDANLLRPRLHRTFRLDNTLGLSSYLSSSMNVQPILLRSFVENLTICVAGPVLTDGASLLSGARVGEFLASVKDQYDRILIDFPSAVSDVKADILPAWESQSVLVTVPGFSTAESVAAISAASASSLFPPLGLVLNMVDPAGSNLAGRPVSRLFPASDRTEKG